MEKYRIRLFFAALAIICGCAPPDIPMPTGPTIIDDALAKPKFGSIEELAKVPEYDFHRFAPLAEGVRNAKEMSLYEGLPNDFREQKRYEDELATKDIV